MLELIRRMRRTYQSTTTRRIFVRLYVITNDPFDQHRVLRHKREFRQGMAYLRRCGLVKQSIDEWILTNKAKVMLQKLHTAHFSGIPE